MPKTKVSDCLKLQLSCSPKAWQMLSENSLIQSSKSLFRLFSVQQAGLLGKFAQIGPPEQDPGKPYVPGLPEGKSGISFSFTCLLQQNIFSLVMFLQRIRQTQVRQMIPFFVFLRNCPRCSVVCLELCKWWIDKVKNKATKKGSDFSWSFQESCLILTSRAHFHFLYPFCVAFF